MTALETQLTEIVEKEQGQKIIPFLQKLTQEERKSLIPCLSRLEEYYNKFVQLEERTYGTRATSGQHHIIDLAALVIFPLKEFRKHEWGINTAHLNEIAAWLERTGTERKSICSRYTSAPARFLQVA